MKLIQNLFRQRSFGASVVILIALLFAPLIIPKFYTYILAVIFVTALLAMSLNLVVGHGGLFQFHHAAFYGVGAYTAGLILAKTSWPWWIGFMAGPIAAALAGFLIGLFCVRLNRLYFGMLQISLGSLIWAIAFRWYSLTGGDDGVHGIPMPEFISSLKSSYYFVLILLAVCLILMYLILKSPFGTTLQAVRDNPERCAAVGIDVKRHQLMGIVVATFFAGVAGVLFCCRGRIYFPRPAFLGIVARSIYYVPFGWVVYIRRPYPGSGDDCIIAYFCRNIHRVLDIDFRCNSDSTDLLFTGWCYGLQLSGKTFSRHQTQICNRC